MAKAITSGILLVNNENKVFLAHPTNHASDFWSIPKGKLEDGETKWEAALRETFEETNISIDKEVIKHIQPKVTYKHKKKDVTIFIVRECDNEFNTTMFDFKCNSNVEESRGGFPEMDDFKWFEIDEARKLMHYAQIPALDTLAEMIKEDEDKLDVLIEEWHNSDSQLPLNEYLGLTQKQYENFVLNGITILKRK